jgi:phosphoglycolate phosphatase
VKATVIFDFDGTLADTFPLVVDISYQLSGGAQRLAHTRIEALRRLPLLRAVRALGVRLRYLPRLILFTRRKMLPYMHDVAAFPGVPEMIRQLHDEGHQLFILSSNKRVNIQVFLESHGLSQYFSGIVTVYYGSVFYKMYGLHKLLRRYKLDKQNCYYVGNERLDMEAAARSGVQPVGVTWSGHERKVLIIHAPLTTVDKPEDIIRLVEES